MDSEKIKQTWQRWWWLAAVLLLFAVRLPWIANRTIPFNFDHGKDSLAVLDLLTTGSLKFVGPWTSIPGLYFGPGWYYLLAPWYLLGNFDPLWGMIGMILLQFCLIVLVKREFGWLSALIIATAPTWITISTSAWNPFPMPLVSFLILISLEKIRLQQQLELKKNKLGWWLCVGMAAAFGFHFSTAYALFYPFIILLTIWFKQIKISIAQGLTALVGFAIPFLPQLAFELKHDFIETKSVLTYLETGGPTVAVKSTLSQIISQTFAELQLAILPDVWTGNQLLTKSIAQLTLGIVVFAILYSKLKHRTWGRWWFEMVVWVAIPTLLYSKLHYNLWYVLGMSPVVVLFVADKVSRLPKALVMLYVGLLICTPLSMVARFYLQDQPILQGSRQFLPVKEKVIEIIREKANGLPFASYHYVPDIYDFTYQYLYLYQAKQGKQLPTEFSYQPSVTPYVVEKTSVLEKLEPAKNTQAPALIFYVVEKPENHEFLQQWWSMQQFQTVLEVVEVSPEVTLYVALPK
jgi:hypothetical protein